MVFFWFGAFWLWIQSRWIRRVLGIKSINWWTTSLLGVSSLLTVRIIMEFIATGQRNVPMHWPDALLFGVCAVLYLGAVSGMQGELGRKPISLDLIDFMGWFFGPIYFQYWLNRLRPPIANETTS
jgi:hypothetical protein